MLVTDEKVVLALLFQVIRGLRRVILVFELLSRRQASRRVIVTCGRIASRIVVKEELLEVARGQLGRVDASRPCAMMVLVLLGRGMCVVVHRSQSLLLLLYGLQNACLLGLVLSDLARLGVACS